MALAYTLGRPGVTSVVIGARTEEQLADNLAAADFELSADERARLDAISAPPLLYPYWHQAKTAADRLGDGRPDPARAAPRLSPRQARAPLRTFLGGMTTMCQVRLSSRSV